MDKKYKILLLLLLGLLILYLIWRIFLRRNNPKGNSSLGDVFFGLEKYETPKEYQILHNLAKNSTPEPLDLGIKEYKREPVPKKLYRTWCTSDPECICGGRKADIDALNSTQKAIPDWEQIIYGDKEIDNFLEKEFGKDHKVTKAYNLINPKYGAARADLFRYLIIYKYGGLYLDMKSCVNGPIPEMPKDKDMWISGWNGGQGAHQHLFPETGEYQNWYIYARKGCPLLKEIIERVVHNIYKLHENPNNIINISESSFKNNGGSETKSKGNVLSTTGPIAMTIAILNSNQINNVQVDTSINYVLDYYCIKDDWLGTKDHYSQQTEPLIFPKKDTNHIPKVVYMTYHDIDSVPQYVFDNINKYCSGYEVKIYNDNMCLEFLEKYYGKEAVEIFNNMENGAHKADFWRYCILYVFGGYYFDIKTDFQTHINNIFDSKKGKTWYTVICSDNSCLYNGIIVTPPHNPVILDAIKHIYNNPKPSDYHNYVRELLNIVNKNCRNQVEVGENEQKDGWNCILLQEKCDINCVNNCDKWGLNCIIVDKEGKKVFNTRYKDFGSWGKQKVENYIQSEKTKDLKTIQEKYNYNIIKNGYIPNIIWQTFYKTKVNEPVFELTNNTMLLNPEFNYKIITDLDIVQIIKDNFSDDILNAFLKLNIGAAKGDFTRYILMYLYGGVYLDLDSSISKPISDFIFEHKEYDNILFIDTHYNFEQWILIAKPRNILLKYTIDEMVRRIMNNVDNIFLVTGPTLFNDVIYYMTTGNNIFDSNTKVNLTNRKKIFLQDNLLSNHGLKVKVITDAPKYGFNFQPEIEGGIYDDSNIKKYIPTWGTKTPNLYKNNTREDYSPVHITIIVTYISDNIISNKRLSALKNNINKYQNISLNVIGKKKEILKTLIEKQRASNENVIDMLNKALITNCEYIIITEDDFYPIDNFYNELIHTVRLLPKNWRTLHLCPGKLWGRSFGEPDEPGKLRWECGTEPNIPYHKSKRFYINGEDNLFLQHEAWLGGPTCFLIQQKNIPNFMEEYKTYNFDDACDVILTKMLSSNDFICRDPLLGYEKTQGLSVFDENLKDIKEDYSPGNIYGKLPNCFITEHVEEGERIIADKYTNPNACVLEFGGGSGAVSTIVQSKLNNPSNHVVIQPIDNENESEKPMFGGITSLEKKRNSCNSKYHIIDHILAKGEGKELLKLVTKPFDTLVVDCENCLVGEYEKNPELFDHIKMIQVERDDSDNSYDSLFSNLNFTLKHIGLGCAGWCTTEVWIKSKEDYSPSRAQFGQDLWALEHHNHKRNGTYLEIGVHDGEKENNTVMMDQEYGWSGVCIDPMMKNMENRSCKQFNVALGSEPGEADFRYGGDNENHSPLAGLDKFATSDDNKKWKDTVSNFKMKKVQVRTPEDVFTDANLPSTIDYMSLDVEGAEMDILKSFPFDKYCVKYATIETNNDKEKEKEMEEFMTQRGYKFEGHKEVDHIFSNTC